MDIGSIFQHVQRSDKEDRGGGAGGGHVPVWWAEFGVDELYGTPVAENRMHSISVVAYQAVGSAGRQRILVDDG